MTMANHTLHSFEIRGADLTQLEDFVTRQGWPLFRARQLFQAIHRRACDEPDSLTDLPRSMRLFLKEAADWTACSVLKRIGSSDGTQKFLFQWADGERTETVLIPTPRRATVCVSTQAGCKFGCRFCASGLNGWRRNLTTAEIMAQVHAVRRWLVSTKPEGSPHDVTHIVFMGTGEPLDNADAVFKAVRLLNHPLGPRISTRRITISTVGLIPGIERMARENWQVELAVSLHGYDDVSRSRLMPVNRRYPFTELMAACRRFHRLTKRQITFEYILIDGLTCHDEAARSLARFLTGMQCKLNLIPYNPVPEFPHHPPSVSAIRRFQQQLKRLGMHATVRTPRGRDVNAACGQLRRSFMTSQV